MRVLIGGAEDDMKPRLESEEVCDGGFEEGRNDNEIGHLLKF